VTIRDPADGGRAPAPPGELPTVAARVRGLAPHEQATVPGGPEPRPAQTTASDDGSDGSAPPRIDGVDPDDERAAAMFAEASAADRYQAGPLLGLGGMGEVVAKTDRATGRTVAVKRMRSELASPTLLRRFAREARIQAQLEHPSIVPVYDVGVEADGASYFTMKKIRGHSLAQVIERLRFGDPAIEARYSRRRLLTILSTVALTVEYAHRRGVIHRDLKPSNVMLGDLGEVYVLDWGLADVVGADATLADAEAGAGAGAGNGAEPGAAAGANDASLAPLAALSGPRTIPEPPREARDVLDAPARPDTDTGFMLGTPGYAAPELIDRAVGAIDGKADVYALGAVLYELLTLERLHAGQTLGQILGSTLELDGAHPSARVADIPPELDALCFDATRLAPAARLPTAAELARRIDAYLDGDRDVALRRRLADVHADEATALIDRGVPGDRAAARRAVTTALGLAPDHPRARAALVRVLTEPGPEAIAGADLAQRGPTTRAILGAARGAMAASATFTLYLPIVLWMGIRSWWQLAAVSAACVGMLALTFHLYRRPLRSFGLPGWHLVASFLALAIGSVVTGPLILLPAIAIATGSGYIATFGKRVPVVMAAMIAVVMVPLGLELAGVIPRSLHFVDGAMVITPRMVAFPRAGTLVFLVVSHVVIIVTALWFVWRVRMTAAAAERRLAIQAWQLAQLVPDDHRDLLADPVSVQRRSRRR
jgi:serine/threonine-protein kinase